MALFLAPEAGAQTPVARQAIEPRSEIYAVYSTVLRERFVNARTARMVIGDSTSSYPDSLDTERHQRRLRFWTRAFASHPVLMTAVPTDLHQRFLAPPPAHVLDPERFALPVPVVRRTVQPGRDPADRWIALYPVIFDATGTRALLEVVSTRDVIFYLERSDGGWRIVREVTLFVM